MAAYGRDRRMDNKAKLPSPEKGQMGLIVNGN